MNKKAATLIGIVGAGVLEARPNARVEFSFGEQRLRIQVRESIRGMIYGYGRSIDSYELDILVEDIGTFATYILREIVRRFESELEDETRGIRRAF